MTISQLTIKKTSEECFEVSYLKTNQAKWFEDERAEVVRLIDESIDALMRLSDDKSNEISIKENWSLIGAPKITSYEVTLHVGKLKK